MFMRMSGRRHLGLISRARTYFKFQNKFSRKPCVLIRRLSRTGEKGKTKNMTPDANVLLVQFNGRTLQPLQHETVALQVRPLKIANVFKVHPAVRALFSSRPDCL